MSQSDTSSRVVASKRDALAGVVDQLVSSLTNFGASGVALILFDDTTFGLFVSLQAAYGLSLAVIRSVVNEPLLHPFDRHTLHARSATAASWMVGVALLVLMVPLALWLNFGSIVVVAIAVCLPFMLVQDTVRYLGFAQGRAHVSLASDLVWLLVQAVSMAVLYLFVDRWSGLEQVALPWLFGGAIASVAGVLFRARSDDGVFRQILDYAKTNAVSLRQVIRENLSFRLAPAGVVLLAGVFMTSGDVGEAFAPRTILGPVNIMFLSATSYGLAVAHRYHRAGDALLQALLRLLVAGLPALALLATSLVILLPDSVLGSIGSVPPTDLRIRITVVGVGLAFVGRNHALRIGLRATGALRESARNQSIAGGLLLVCGTAGAFLAGPVGAISGIAASHVMAGVLWERSARSLMQHGVNRE